MLDWLTLRIHTPHRPLPSGRLLAISPDGEVDYELDRGSQIEGSHSSKMRLKTVTEDPADPLLELSGNPLKFLQGHNLFGSDDLAGLLSGVYCRLRLEHPELDLPEPERDKELHTDITRIDITYMYDLGSNKDVESYIFAAAKTARSRNQTGMLEGQTLYFQKRSSRWAFKIYNKLLELKKHNLPDSIRDQEKLLSWANGKLRCELTLRSKELAKFEVLKPPSELFEMYRSRITMAKNIGVPKTDLSGLTGNDIGYYEAWRSGHDLRKLVSKNTFYRIRRTLLKELDVDISVRQIPDDDDNVTPFIRTLQPVPVLEIPDFACDTELYFDPDVQKRQLKML